MEFREAFERAAPVLRRAFPQRAESMLLEIACWGPLAVYEEGPCAFCGRGVDGRRGFRAGQMRDGARRVLVFGRLDAIDGTPAGVFVCESCARSAREAFGEIAGASREMLLAETLRALRDAGESQAVEAMERAVAAREWPALITTRRTRCSMCGDDALEAVVGRWAALCSGCARVVGE